MHGSLVDAGFIVLGGPLGAEREILHAVCARSDLGLLPSHGWIDASCADWDRRPPAKLIARDATCFASHADGATRLYLDSGPMSLHLFAGLRVRDFQAARAWYERLLGEPTFFPHATEAVWTLADERSIYVVEHPDGAGNGAVTIFLDDLDAQIAAITGRGLEPDERETYSNGVRKVIYRDPDGNELGFGGAPLDTGANA